MWLAGAGAASWNPWPCWRPACMTASTCARVSALSPLRTVEPLGEADHRSHQIACGLGSRGAPSFTRSAASGVAAGRWSVPKSSDRSTRSQPAELLSHSVQIVDLCLGNLHHQALRRTLVHAERCRHLGHEVR